MNYKIGDRVGAIQSIDHKEVLLFGYGIYAGEELPDEHAGGLCQAVREAGKNAFDALYAQECPTGNGSAPKLYEAIQDACEEAYAIRHQRKTA